MPPEPGPKGGGVGRVSKFLLRPPCGFVSHATEVAAVQAKVSQFAVGQFAQLAQGLTIDGTTGHVFTQAGHEFRDRPVAACGVAVHTAMDQIENSHFIHSFVLRLARSLNLVPRCWNEHGPFSAYAQRPQARCCYAETTWLSLERRHNALINREFFKFFTNSFAYI